MHLIIPWDFLMNHRGVLIVRLPMGQIGKENAFMLGSLIMVKLQQLAMGRARMPEKDRKPFFCYVDECQHFVTPSMAEILSGARKYGLALVLAHQDLHQLSCNKDVEAAVMTNAATRVVFRISESDARSLKGDFAHYDLKDFAELPNLHALARIGSADRDFNLRIERPDDPDTEEAAERRQEVIEENHRFYTIPRAQMEAEILRQLEEDAERAKTAKPPKAKKGKPEAGPEPSPSAPSTPPAPSATPPEVGTPQLQPPASPVSELGTTQVLPADSVPEPTLPERPPGQHEAAPAAEVGASQVPPPSAGDDALSPGEVSSTSEGGPGKGVGGLQHRLIVGRLFEDARAFGFVTGREKTVSKGRVDLAVSRQQCRIAFEVAVDSNTSHELENLTKCLEESFDHVVSVSAQPNVLRNIEKAARKTFPAELFGKLKFFKPEAVAPWLEGISASLPPEGPPTPERINSRGRVIIKNRKALNPNQVQRHFTEMSDILGIQPPLE